MQKPRHHLTTGGGGATQRRKQFDCLCMSLSPVAVFSSASRGWGTHCLLVEVASKCQQVVVGERGYSQISVSVGWLLIATTDVCDCVCSVANFIIYLPFSLTNS